MSLCPESQANLSCNRLDNIMGTYINRGNSEFRDIVAHEYVDKSSLIPLVNATIAGNETAVAQAIDLANDENTSILSYNDENSLACVLTVAYIWARNEYVIHREYATGKGYADLVMIPRRNVNKPALVIELKFNNSVDTAIDQIKRKEYPAKIAEYSGNILLVGINYDRETKKHTCRIEKGITSANNPNVFSFAVEG